MTNQEKIKDCKRRISMIQKNLDSPEFIGCRKSIRKDASNRIQELRQEIRGLENE